MKNVCKIAALSQVPAPCSCSVWPCPTCGAVDWEDAGNKCKADWVCAADDQRQLDYEREQSTPNAEHHARPERSDVGVDALVGHSITQGERR